MVNRNDVQFVIAAVFLGLAVGQFFFGPLSDRAGRKPAIYVGLILFMAGSLMSVFARTFEVMMVGRVLQGIGVAGPRVVTMALVRDQYEGRQMARLMSFATSLFILVPTIAPALGQGIQWLAGWRAIFASFFRHWPRLPSSGLRSGSRKPCPPRAGGRCLCPPSAAAQWRS